MYCRTNLTLLSTLWILCVFTSEASLAHTSRTVAVDSNILVFDGKVLFAQGTGSLTMLDLDTGKVLLRKSPPHEFDFRGTLLKHKLGIVMSRYSRTALLDAETLDIVWSVENSYRAAIGKDYFIAHDGYHTVTCFEIATGKQVWSTIIEGGWELLAVGNRAVVSTDHMYDKRQAVKLFELDTGQEIFTRRAKEDEQFINVFFDGSSVYLLTARKDGPEPDIDPVPEKLTKIGLDGLSLRTFDFQSNEIESEHGYKTYHSNFFLEGRHFSSDGYVRDAYPHEPNEQAAVWGENKAFAETVPSGVFVEGRIQDESGKKGTVLQFTAEHGDWSGYATHLGEDDRISKFTESEHRLLLASGGGHVECIDISTGQSQWLYVFPVIRRTMSFSRYGMPPMLTERAAAYRGGLAELGAAAGTLAIQKDIEISSIDLDELRTSTPYLGRIIVDPQPDDPFADFVPKLVYRAAAFAAIPVIFMAIVVSIAVHHRRQSAETDGTTAALHSKDYLLFSGLALPLAAIPFAGIMFYGRVDPIIGKCLWSVLGLTFVFFFYAGYKAMSAGS